MERTAIPLNQPANFDHVTWWRHDCGVWLQHNALAPGRYRLALPPLPGQIREVELLCNGGRGPKHEKLPEVLPRLRLRMVHLGVEGQDLGDATDAPADVASYESEHGFTLYLPYDPSDPNKGIPAPHRSYQVIITGEAGDGAVDGGFSFDHLVVGTEPVEVELMQAEAERDVRRLRARSRA